MRILVVDDDENLAGAVKRGLQGVGYAVDVALDGCEGHWMASENAYDAMVLDSMLPGMSGPVMCVALRDAGVWTPILMLTAKTGDGEEAQALDAGADDFLGEAVLVRRPARPAPRAAPSRRSGAPARAGRRGPAARPCRAPRLAWGNAGPAEPRGSSPSWSTLMRHPGDVLSKTRIMEHVWDYTFDGDPNIVEVYVRQLRLRIDEPFGRSALQTVRGVGYRLDADGG